MLPPSALEIEWETGRAEEWQETTHRHAVPEIPWSQHGTLVSV